MVNLLVYGGNKMKKKSIKKNYIYNLFYQIITVILPVITAPYLSRVIGAEAIGIHSYSHDYNYLYPNKSVNTDNFMADVEKTNEALRNVLGDDFETKAIRLPGGHMTWKNTQALDDLFKQNGYSKTLRGCPEKCGDSG